jgi:glycosyltransferase involved in cell wall biosynthesis
MNLHANLGRIVDNVFVIPHGAAGDVSISREKAKKRLGLGRQQILGMIGWFTSTKGYDRVLAIWDELSEQLGEKTVLVLAGDARRGDLNQIEYKKQLLSMVEQCRHKDRIVVKLGSFDPEQYNQIMAAFDLMVMPYTFASQSGNLAHSFALGVPAVVSGLEGLKAEAEASGGALAFRPGDSEDLKRAILSLMQNENLRKTCAARAKAYVNKKISWSITAKKHLRVYKQAAQFARKGQPDLIAASVW